MEINQFIDLDLDNAEKRVSIKILSDKDNFYCIWLDKGVLFLEFHLIKKDNVIFLLNGKIGDLIDHSTLTEEQKIERCAESIEHVLSQLNYDNKLNSTFKIQ